MKAAEQARYEGRSKLPDPGWGKGKMATSTAMLAVGATTDGTGSHESRSRQSSTPGWFAIARRLHDLPTWARYAIATLLVLIVTFLMRYTVVHDAPGYHFIFFVPPVILSSLFLAQGSGIWAVLLSTAVIKAFLLAPVFTLEFARGEDFWTLVLFLGTGLVTALSGEALHKAFFQIADANAKLTAAYDRIAASEREKEILLHDLTHRFKNDLANLTAILRLQARDVADPSARTELIAASERVHVMGRVHQRLARFGQGSMVDMREFLTDLCEDLRIGMIGSRPIALRAEVEAGQFPFAQAITIGLIVNELVTNAVKYAFPPGRPGTIRVSLDEADGHLRLGVEDDGVGLGSGRVEGTGIGMDLVRALCQQLGGKLEVTSRQGGARFSVAFPSASPTAPADDAPRPAPSLH